MSKFRIVTNGEVAPGHHEVDVRKNLVGLCKYNDDQLDALFSGFPFVFKSGLDDVMSQRYKAALDKAGIVTTIEEVMPELKIEIDTHDTDAISHHPHSSDEQMMACPKCSEQQPRRMICSACGIVVDKFLRQQQQHHQQSLPEEFIPQEEEYASAGAFTSIMLRLLVLTILAGGGYLGYKSFFAESREVVFYTFDNCEPCDVALNFLKSEGIECTVYNIDDSTEIATQYLKASKGKNKMPLVFLGDVRIDGYNPAKYQVGAAKYKGTLAALENPEIVMYSTDRCGFCRRAKKYFSENNIAYTELDIDVSTYMAEYRKLGGRGTPLIIIGGKVRLDGFHEDSLELALSEAGLL